MEITVRDTGIGISEENLENLFTDYYQVETHASRRLEGTGLGLSITKKLTEIMNGNIVAESTLGKGTIFRVRILQGYVDNTPIGREIAENLRKFRHAEDNRIVSKKLVRPDMSFARVLVVDDMQTNLDVAAGLLGKYKMQIDCVLSGPEAVERIRQGVPVYNAIFMDHMMPEMDGVETADAIRNLSTKYAKEIPIIALTANAIQGTEEMFYVHGFQAFLSKPIDIMQMDSVIRKWIKPSSAIQPR
jgi:CheY-like chemotaxis protein